MARTKKRLSTVTDYGDDDDAAQLSDMLPTPRTEKVTLYIQHDHIFIY